MFNQQAKWLDVSRGIRWRRPVASLNILLTSHVWRQDHNGFSHQDPGFIDVACNKKPEVVRVYLPPDANCLLWVADQCLRSRNRINVIVAGKNAQPQWLDAEVARRHCERGIGVFEWASTDGGAGHGNLHVRGYKEEGSTTTPFDMAVLSDIDRYRLAMDVARRVPSLAALRADIDAAMGARREAHRRYIREHGIDMPEVTGWRWTVAAR